MKKLLLLAGCAVLIWLGAVTACNKDKDEPPANRPPAARAGLDQRTVIPRDSVLLNGRASTDADGRITAYKWVQVQGPATAFILQADSVQTVVRSLVQGVYQFELTVTDNEGAAAKDTTQVTVEGENHSPVASAGPDTTVTLETCSGATGVAELDGSGSSDPDTNIVSYQWVKREGPEGYTLRNRDSAKARVENMLPGRYVFELTVRDARGGYATDEVQIDVKGITQEYDIDVTFSANLQFIDNYEYCYWYCYYYDYTTINGSGNDPVLGKLNLSILETADTSASSTQHETGVQIYNGNVNAESIGGFLTVNFKSLVAKGGGAFGGTLTLTNGTATSCDPNVFSNAAPLAVTGTLNLTTATTGTVVVRIKGKLYF